MLKNTYSNFTTFSWTPRRFLWYDCKVVTIKKPDKNPELASSYRPICLLSCLRKLFEKILNTRLDYWMESRKISSTTQFGFRKGFRTQDCLAVLSTDLETTFTYGYYSCL